MSKAYFPGLNTLRFYAALSVVFYHLSAPVIWFSDPDAMKYANHVGFMHGHDAVTLFFALSGFLIFTLLIREKDTTGTISIRRFYIRRAFRILPLYYLTALAGAVVVTLNWQMVTPRTISEATNPLIWVGTALFFYNFLMSQALPITHLWSLNVEEQFYFIAPQLIKRTRAVPAALMLLMSIKLILHLGVYLWFQATGDALARYLLVILEAVRFEALALGGLGAYLVYTDHALLQVLFHRAVQIASAVGVAAIILRMTPSNPITDLLSAGVFAVFITNTAAAPRCFYRLETPLLRRLGDLSYAIYMAHAPVLWLLYAAGARGLVYVFAGITLTLACAYAVNITVERPFMRLRERLSSRTTTKQPIPTPVSGFSAR